MDIQIIVGTSQKNMAQVLSQCLTQNGYRVLAHCEDGQDILRRIATNQVDLLILEPTIKGISAKEVAHIAIDTYTIPVIILANDTEATYFYDMQYYFGFACIQNPLSKQVLLQSITLLINSVKTVRKLKAELNHLTKELKEHDYLKEAKEHLMRTRGMSEPEAHKYIQICSMNTKLSKEDVSKKILYKKDL